MQEEVENRTLTLAVSGTKFTGRLLKAAITKYLAHRKDTHTISANGCVIAPVTRFTLSLLISPDGSIIPLSKSTFFMSSSYNLWCQNGARSYKIILYGDTAR